MNSIFKKTIINSKKFKEIPVAQIKSIVEKNNFAILRNFISPAEALNTLNKVKKNFKSSNDRIRKPGDYDKIKSNYQRLMIGNTGGIKLTNPRYFRVFYNPTFCKDIYDAKKLYKKMLIIQNRLYKLEDNYSFNVKKTPHNLFCASRIQHYPAGGGFLAMHKDLSAINSSKEIKKNLYYNVLLNLTEKGIDFKTGGSFIEVKGKKNKFFNIDDIAKRGDIIIYSGKTNHGVSTIDENTLLNRDTKSGRYVALVTLFKH
jgi:hypothetical protein